MRTPLSWESAPPLLALALGLLLPGTERENELMGPARDELVDRAEKTAERVKDAATEAGREVKETVKAEIADHAPEVKQVAQQAGQTVKDQVKESAKKVKRKRRTRPRSPAQPQERNMSLDSLEKLFLEELKDVYNAEKQILPCVAEDGQSRRVPRAGAGLYPAPEGD